MRGVWSNKLLFWNFVMLFAIQSIGSASQLAALISDPPVFSGSEIVAATNIYRASVGASSLKESSVLNTAAAQKLEDMIRSQYFAHYSPGGVSPWHWFQANNYRYTYAGENLAIGYPDAATTVDAWVKSSTHRNNLINKQYREIGVAVARAQIQGDQGILVVQMFGAPAGSAVTLSSSDASPRIDVSQSDASESTPTPAPVAVSPAVVRTPAPTMIAQSEPRITSIERESTTSRFTRVLRSTYIAYTYIILMFSLAYLLFREFRKDLVLKTALHFFIFWLAATLPTLVIAAGKIM